MRPGTYRLTTDIINPYSDRRFTRDWRAFPRLEAGSVFYVAVSADYLTCHRQGAHSCYYVTPTSPMWALLAARLEPIAETASDLLARESWAHCAPDCLDVLVEQGKVTLEDIRAALEIYLSR